MFPAYQIASQAGETATLCLYALSDIFIHNDGFTPKELSTFFAGYGFPKESSDLIYQTLVAEPGAYLPYAVDYLEFMELQHFFHQLFRQLYFFLHKFNDDKSFYVSQ